MENEKSETARAPEPDTKRLFLMKSGSKEMGSKGYLIGKENGNFANLDDQLESARRPLIDSKNEQAAKSGYAGAGNLTMKEIIKNKILAKKKQIEERNQTTEIQKESSVQREPLKQIENVQNSILAAVPKIVKIEQQIPLAPPAIKKDPPAVQNGGKSAKLKMPSIETNLLEGSRAGNTKLNFQRPISPIKKQRFLQHESLETDSEVSPDEHSPVKPVDSSQIEFEEIPLDKPIRRRQTPSPEPNDMPEKKSLAVKDLPDAESSEPNKKSKQGLESSQNFPKKSKLARLTSGEYEKMVCKVQDIDLSNMRLFALRTVPEGQIIQCTIVRDRSGIINKFYPIFHLYLSVN